MNALQNGGKPGQTKTPSQPTQQQTIPVHRFNEVVQAVRELKEQNQMLRQTLDQTLLTRQNYQQPQRAQAPEQVEDSPFEPKTAQAIKQMFQKEIGTALSEKEAQFKQSLGYLADQNDELRFRLSYPNANPKMLEKVEQLRQQKSQQGQWVTREEAYKLIHFDTTGRKPQVQNRTVQPGEAPQEQIETLDSLGTEQYQEPPQQAQQYQYQEEQPQQVDNFDPGLPPAAYSQGTPAPRMRPQAPTLTINSTPEEVAAWEDANANKTF